MCIFVFSRPSGRSADNLRRWMRARHPEWRLIVLHIHIHTHVWVCICSKTHNLGGGGVTSRAQLMQNASCGLMDYIKCRLVQAAGRLNPNNARIIVGGSLPLVVVEHLLFAPARIPSSIVSPIARIAEIIAERNSWNRRREQIELRND